MPDVSSEGNDASTSSSPTPSTARTAPDDSYIGNVVLGIEANFQVWIFPPIFSSLNFPAIFSSWNFRAIFSSFFSLCRQWKRQRPGLRWPGRAGGAEWRRGWRRRRGRQRQRGWSQRRLRHHHHVHKQRGQQHALTREFFLRARSSEFIDWLLQPMAFFNLDMRWCRWVRAWSPCVWVREGSGNITGSSWRPISPTPRHCAGWDHTTYFAGYATFELPRSGEMWKLKLYF